MRKSFIVSLLALGVTSAVTQVLMLRELLITFYGNEFFIGWTLFAWLLWTGIGAGVASGWRGHHGDGLTGLKICHLLAAVLLPVTILLVRSVRLWASPVPGASPNLMFAMLQAVIVLAPVCLALGAQFVFAARAWGQYLEASEGGESFSRSYAWETAGFVIGGFLFSFLLVTWNEFAVAAALGGLNVLVIASLRRVGRVGRVGQRVWDGLILAAGVGMILLAVQQQALENWSGAWRFPKQTLLASQTTRLGHVAVTATERQINFHENGMLLGTDDEQQAAELLAHLPMLWHARPKQVLLIGGGFNGALHEILKHGPERVDYIEFDPGLLEMAQEFAGASARAALQDSRVRIVAGDGRYELRRQLAQADGGGYDVAIINLPAPSTALLNRYYSLEFFRDVRQRLASEGVLAVRLAWAPDYIHASLGKLGASIHRALRTQFETVVILPEYELFFLATAEASVPPTADELAERFQEREVRADFVHPAFLEYRLTTDRIGQARDAFAANAEVGVNRDLHPVACYYQFAYWLTAFHPWWAARALAWDGVRWWQVALGMVALLGLARLFSQSRPQRWGLWCMGAGSFTLMAFELVILLAFQSFYGYLYHQLALLLAVLMAGMTAGAMMGVRWGGRHSWRALQGIHLLVAVVAVGLLLWLRGMTQETQVATRAGMGMFFVWAFGAGALAGFEFPMANRLYAGASGQRGRRGGVVYAVDLFGSCLAALGLGLWALPVLGATTTLGLLAFFNAALTAALPGGGPRGRGRGGAID